MFAQVGLVAGTMVLAIYVSFRHLRAPAALALAAAAVIGALVGGFGLPVRRIIEGSMAYLNFNLVIIVAGILVTLLRDSGLLRTIIADLTRALHRWPYLLLLGLGFATILPGALTGSGTVAVIAMGPLVGPILMSAGLSRLQAAAVVGLSGLLSLVAPPVNIYGMVMSAGLNLPYQDTLMPALIVTVALEIIVVLWIGWGKLKRQVDVGALDLVQPSSGQRVQAYLPLALVLALVLLSRTYPLEMPAIGLPGVFAAGILILFALRRNVKELHEASLRTMDELLPILGIMTAIGILVQILSLTGVKGVLITGIMILPLALAYGALFFVLPFAGCILAFGAAAVFGLPFLWANAGIDPRISIVGLSLAISIGALIPPTALTGRFSLAALQYTGSYASYARVLAAPVMLINLAAIAVAAFANHLTFLLG